MYLYQNLFVVYLKLKLLFLYFFYKFGHLWVHVHTVCYQLECNLYKQIFAVLFPDRGEQINRGAQQYVFKNEFSYLTLYNLGFIMC